MIGAGEMVFIAAIILIACLVLGKGKLPGIGRDAGKAVREFNKAVNKKDGIAKKIGKAVKPIQKVIEKTRTEFDKGLKGKK